MLDFKNLLEIKLEFKKLIHHFNVQDLGKLHYVAKFKK